MSEPQSLFTLAQEYGLPLRVGETVWHKKKWILVTDVHETITSPVAFGKVYGKQQQIEKAELKIWEPRERDYGELNPSKLLELRKRERLQNA